MIRTAALHRALLVVLLCSSRIAAAEGDPAAYPSWEERVIHQWINRARVEPAPELADCGANCSVAERAPGCYAPKPPLFLGAGLAMAARFHSASMAKQGFFAHATPCQLRGDLASVFPEACDGSAACACAGTGSTSPGGRVARFGGSYSGEIIAAGYPDPLAAFYGWLHEPVASNAPCDWSSDGGWNTNGHRWLILTSTGSVGAGYASGGSWGRYFTADFGGGGEIARIPSGAHYPRQAPTI
ncbi:MAG TPA: CAP domain-containing protein, partial [Thermoanaerobaculia bacterium]